MRFAILTLIAAVSMTALAQAPYPGVKMKFPFTVKEAKITVFQPGNSGRQPDIYVLENETTAVEIQCGREFVIPKKMRKTLNCSVKITLKESEQKFLYGINDFYQAGTEEFFRGLGVGTEVKVFMIGSLQFPKSVMMVVGGELRTYLPAANEDGLLVEAQVAPVTEEKSSHK